jgi:toluene monooxygenase system ferredoxin subunit
MTFRKVASLDELWSGEMIGLDVGGNSVLLVNVDDHIYAYVDACPHQRTRLSEGYLLGKTLRCATHHWEFEVCTGQGINPQNACLQTLPVTVENRDILLDLDEERSTESVAGSESER